MTESDSSRTEQADSPVELPQRSALTALWLLIALGYLGAHRFYLGKWISGALVPLVVFSLASALEFEQALPLYGLFVVVDGLLIRHWVRLKNAAIREEFSLHPERYLIADDDHIAPWARGRDKRSELGLNASARRTLIFFFVLPLGTGWQAAQLQSLELLIIPLVLLASIGLITSLDQTLVRFPTLLEVPGVGPALERVADMRAHYWEHEPKILEAFLGLFQHARTRYRPYWSLVSIVIATILIEAIINFEDNTNYIPLDKAALIVGTTALIAAVVTLLNLVPVTALAFHYSLSGKSTRLKLMTLGAVLATVIGYGSSTYYESHDGSGAIPSRLSAMRLDARMADPQFRAEVLIHLEFFLNYYVGSGTKESEMRERLSMLMQSIAPNDEAIAFGILDHERWSAVQYYHGKGACFTDPDNRSVGDASKLPITREYDDETVQTIEPEPYSILALVYKPTEEEELSFLNFLLEQELSPLDVVRAMDQKNVYYRWEDMDDEMRAAFNDVLPAACQRLLCDEPGDCQPTVP